MTPTPTTRDLAISHAAACRAALAAGLPRPRWEGGSLRGANLAGADISGARLSGANLTWADLAGAHLADANLTGADLTGANLADANLAGAELTVAIGIATEAEEAATWAAVREAILADPSLLAMHAWHGSDWDPDAVGTCGTTHCLAGWAQALATDPEVRGLSAELAGSRLLPRHAHLFYGSDSAVLALLRREVSVPE